MKTRTIPDSYYANLKREVGWNQVLNKLGIKFKQKKIGYITKCIFHQENTPSLYLNMHSGFFYCFGCGENGDMFTFISYVLTGNKFGNRQKTCRWLKKCFGIPLPW